MVAQNSKWKRRMDGLAMYGLAINGPAIHGHTFKILAASGGRVQIFVHGPKILGRCLEAIGV